jgi:hypothetical protein
MSSFLFNCAHRTRFFKDEALRLIVFVFLPMRLIQESGLDQVSVAAAFLSSFDAIRIELPLNHFTLIGSGRLDPLAGQ